MPDLPKEVPDLKLEVPDRRSGGIRPNLSTGYWQKLGRKQAHYASDALAPYLCLAV